VINLAVIDMLVGGIVVYDLFYRPGVVCNYWKWLSIEEEKFYFMLGIVWLLPLGSLVNIAITALERVHATFFPFEHLGLKKWLYRLLIAVVWVIPGSITTSFILLTLSEETVLCGLYMYGTSAFICILINCVSYTSIVIKVRVGAQLQRHGAAGRERKLTMTLLIMTVVSMLLYLPPVLHHYAILITKFEIVRSLSPSTAFHLSNASLFLFYANSLVNPVLYAIRIPEYRSAVLGLFCKRPQQQRQVTAFPLRDM